MHEEHFTFIGWTLERLGFHHVPNHVSHAIFVVVLLSIVFLIARLSLARARKRPDHAMIPPAKLTYRNFFEIIAEAIYDFTKSILGEHDAKTYFPVVGSLFLLVLTSNLLGLIPGFSAPTDNMNTTLALGLAVYIYYNAHGFRANGFVGYLKHFAGPLWYLAPFMFVIEIFSHAIRPLSLSLRLKWNVAIDHIVVGAFSQILEYGLPVIFMVMGLFVSVVQAFVFTVLTMVYISMATAHDH